MKSLAVSSQNKNKNLKAQIIDDGDIILQFDEDTFSNFISNLLKEKQLLEKKYKGAILLTHTELIEFYHLIHYKFKSQSNILSDTESIRVYYNTGERHVLHSIEQIEKYNEPRNIVPVRVNLNFKCFVKDIEKNKIYNTDISIVIQTMERNPYGEIEIVIQHNDRLFASEVINMLEPLIQRVIQKPTIYQNSYLLIKKINIHIFMILFAIVMSTILIFSFYTYTPVSGITELSQQSIDLLNEGRGYHKQLSIITEKHDKEFDSYTDDWRKLNEKNKSPIIQFQDLLLDNEMITDDDLNLSILTLSYIVRLESYGLYNNLYTFYDRAGSFDYDEEDTVDIENDKYIFPKAFERIDKAQEDYYSNKRIVAVKDSWDNAFKSLKKLIDKRYVNEEYKALLRAYLDVLGNDYLATTKHIDNMIKLPEKYNPIMLEVQRNILMLKEKASERPAYTVTNFTKYILMIFFFSLPIFFLLQLLNESKSFLSLNSYTKKLEKYRGRKQLAFKVSLFGTIIISVSCSLFASGIYNFLSHLF
jgi:hypothetical protein